MQEDAHVPPRSSDPHRLAARRIDVTDDDLLTMLRAIDAASGPLDSSSVARRLGWTAATTASSLSDAKASMLVWGIRVGGTSYEDIELTVQGRRLLRTSGASAD
jgi:hypothetical protein